MPLNPGPYRLQSQMAAAGLQVVRKPLACHSNKLGNLPTIWQLLNCRLPKNLSLSLQRTEQPCSPQAAAGLQVIRKNLERAAVQQPPGHSYKIALSMAVKILAGIIFTGQEVNVLLTISCPLAANTYRIPRLVAVTGDLSPATPSSKATLNNTGSIHQYKTTPRNLAGVASGLCRSSDKLCQRNGKSNCAAAAALL